MLYVLLIQYDLGLFPTIIFMCTSFGACCSGILVCCSCIVMNKQIAECFTHLILGMNNCSVHTLSVSVIGDNNVASLQ